VQKLTRLCWRLLEILDLCMAQIVPPDLRNLVYAFDRSFEMAIAALAAPLVGILAEHVFGFAVCTARCQCSQGIDTQC